MGYPMTPGYPAQQPQPGYGYPVQAAPGGYPAAGPAMGSGGYDFSQLFGMADFSGGRIPEGTYDALVTSAEYGSTRAGDKGQWIVGVTITTGPQTGHKLTSNITISPKTNDGRDNGAGIARMFRDLAALGIPVPDPANPAVTVNGPAPFFTQGWNEQQVAQAMLSKPCQIVVKDNDWEGGTNSRIRQFMVARPDAPTQVPQQPQPQPQPQAQQQQQQQAPQWGAQPPQPVAYAQPQAPQGYPQQPQQPGAYAQQPPGWAQPAAQPAPWQPITQQAAAAGAQPPAAPWQPQAAPAAAPMQPGGPAPQGAPPVPGAPSWAQPGVPGQGGTGEFTQQGQSQQPAPFQAPWQQANGSQPQAQQPQQEAPQQAQQQPGAPPRPPWAQ